MVNRKCAIAFYLFTDFTFQLFPKKNQKIADLYIDQKDVSFRDRLSNGNCMGSLFCHLSGVHDLDTLAESAQHDLFHHSRHSAHCLNHLYTAKLRLPGAMRLRARGHDFELPTVKYLSLIHI